MRTIRKLTNDFAKRLSPPVTQSAGYANTSGNSRGARPCIQVGHGYSHLIQAQYL